MNARTLVDVARQLRRESPDFQSFQSAFPRHFARALRVTRAIECMPACVRDVPVFVEDLGAQHGRYDDATDTVYLNEKLFDGQAVVGTVDQLTFVVCHEFGHALMHHKKLHGDPAWLALSAWMCDVDAMPPYFARYTETRDGWTAGSSRWCYQENTWFTRIYASKSPDEDFVDCAAYVALGWQAAFQFGGAEKLAYVTSAAV